MVLRVARGDRDLGAQGVLALADGLRDARGELLGLERRGPDDRLADRVVDGLLEARHVRALLLRTQIDEALQVRAEQLLADADDLLHARHADARERHVERRKRRLDVVLRCHVHDIEASEGPIRAITPTACWCATSRGGHKTPLKVLRTNVRW
jgi:hypothetical protein